MKKTHSGFTLVELVVVILILGILSATALPRFMDVSSQAHDAGVAGVGGSFGAAVALAHAQYVANVTVGADNAVAGFGQGNVSVNASGWPVNINSATFAVQSGTTTTDAGTNPCINVWTNILQGPPTISTGTGSDYQVTVINSTEATAQVLSGGAEITSATNTLTSCTYQYQADTSKAIVYNAINGNVTVSQ